MTRSVTPRSEKVLTAPYFRYLTTVISFESKSFSDLASAEAFFSNNNLIDIALGGGLNNIQLAFNETMSSGEGFSFNYAAAGGVSATPLPPTWTMMLVGLAGFGFVASRRKSKPALMAA